MKSNLTLLVFVLFFFSFNEIYAGWQPVNGPYGGYSTCIKVKGQNVFAGTYDHGVFISSDNGNTWSARNNGLMNPYITALGSLGSRLFAATSAGLYYSDDDGDIWNTILVNSRMYFNVSAIATNSQSVFVCNLDTLMRSTDNGATWQTILWGIPGLEITCLTVSGQDVYVGAYGSRYYVSHDNGNNFDWVDLSGQGMYSLGAFLVSGSKILTISGGYVYISSDGGITWEGTFGIDYPYITGLASNGSRLFAEVNSNYYYPVQAYGYYYSDDGGVHWTYGGLRIYQITGFGVIGSRLITCTNAGIFLSDDAGNSWNEPSTGLVRLLMNSFAISGSSIYAASANEGMLKSKDNGNTWTHINNSLPLVICNAVAVNSSRIFAGGYYIYSSLDDGVTWQVKYGPGNLISCFAVMGNRIFAGTGVANGYGDGILLSEDHGETWHFVNNGLGSSIIYSLTVDGNNLYAGTDAGVYVTNNYGTSWTALNNGLVNPHITALCKSQDHLFAAAYYPDLWLEHQSVIYSSVDNGQSWSNTGFEYQDYSGSSSLVTGGNKVVTGLMHSLYPVSMTDDNGVTWSDVSSGLPYESNVQFMAIHDSTVYAAINLSTYGNGNQYGSGIWKCPLSDMKAFRLSPDTLLIDRETGSIASLTISSSNPWSVEGTLVDWLSADKVSGQGTDQIVFTATKANPYEPPRYFPLDFVSNGQTRHLIIVQAGKLAGIGEKNMAGFRIYPNPSNSDLFFSFGLAKNDNVKIAICNLTGQTFDVITNQEYTLGAYQIKSDISNLPAGCYICTFMTSDYTTSAKLMVVK